MSGQPTGDEVEMTLEFPFPPCDSVHSSYSVLFSSAACLLLMNEFSSEGTFIGQFVQKST